MLNRITRHLNFYSCVCFVIFLLITPSLAQSDPNPNSPSPVLLSEKDVSRALVIDANAKVKGVPNAKSKAFKLNSKINLYISDVELMEGEGANAFRVYAKDSKNRLYRFRVVALDRIHKRKPIYALTVKLRDEIGFWKQPSETGDLLVQVTWRGMGSNKLLLGLGKTGGLAFDSDKETVKNTAETPTSNYVGYRWSGDRKRLLEQATFGPTDALDWRVRRIGPRVWIEEQLNAPYPSPAFPYPENELKSGNQMIGCPFDRTTPEYRECQRNFYSQYLTQNWFFKEAFYGDAQLRHRVAWALHQLWVTSGLNIIQGRHMVEYHKVLSRNAFGNYRNLMEEMTLNPAMGEYLDMARSTANNPNENYAREILQLFTIGLFMLNPDGTLQLDGNNQPIPTYDQTTVNNFTKVFTGWRLCADGNNPACPNAVLGTQNFIDPLAVLIESQHDSDSKTLLSYPDSVHENIPADLDPDEEMDRALDNIFNHPNVAPFVSKFLIQHLVTSDPTPSYVGRISAVFNNNGQSVRGDLRAVVKAILMDPEARGDVKTDPNYGKLREPVQLTTNIYRRLNVQSFDGSQQSDGYVWWIPQLMGQRPFYPPTVFNYYSPGYVVPGTTLLAPEFGILNTSTSINRINMTTIMGFINLEPTVENPPDAPLGTGTDVSKFTRLVQTDPTGNLLLDELDRNFMHSTMTPTMRSNILNAVLAVNANDPEFRARTAIFLVVSSADYQIQR